MHYKNGREAKVGDRIFKPGDQHGPPQAGVLVEPVPGNQTCNGRILPVAIIWNLPSITVGECYHVDDVQLPPAAPTAG